MIKKILINQSGFLFYCIYIKIVKTVAKVKVVNSKLDSNLNGSNFTDTPSNTIFSFGSFFITSNFDNKVTLDYSKTLSTFVRPVTLETLGYTEIQSEIVYNNSTSVVLNLDKSDLNTFVRYGSAYEFLRVSIQNIILAYPASLFANNQVLSGGNNTYEIFSYDDVSNISTFYVPIACLNNNFGLIYNDENQTIPDDNELRNLNLSYDKYVISTSLEPEIPYNVIGFTGNSVNSSDFIRKNYIKLNVEGNPFSLMGTGTTGSLNFHIKPNNVTFEEFRAQLNPYEKYIVSERNDINGFQLVLKTPVLLDNGEIIYSNTLALWSTSDGYNIDINTSKYQKFLEIILTIGAKYDAIKTDLIARFLTPSSLKTYDLTEEGKMTKLLKIYGREFDQIRQFIDSLVHINKVTYDKINNIPDQLVMNMAKTFGWDYFSLINESELMNSFLTVDELERNLNEDLLPAEIDIELWRRILNNTNYFWKSKGTRESLKSMFLLIGIPEPFINITEYVYTVEGKINPNTVSLSQYDFPTNSLPYDNSGYPVAPLETKDFYFQISGDTDAGQRYMDVFRMAGFNLIQTVDNKKSWVQTGATTRTHYSTPQYYQGDSKLVINTKTIDVALDTAQGIEFDVYTYIKDTDYPANNSGYTLPFSYVNISLNYTGTQNTFQLPTPYDKTLGDLEVRYNGILLNAPKTGTTTGITTNADYSVSGNSFTILNGNYAINSGNRRDVIQATFVYSGNTQPITGITVEYIVTRVRANLSGTIIPLPSTPRGDVQLTINGIAITKGVSSLNGDYTVDAANNRIVIFNPDVITYLISNPEIQVAYVEVNGSDNINLRSEVIRIDSFNSSKIYFNQSANKYVYKLNYKANDAKEIKFLVDGIALEPYKDYNINIMNPFEVYLPKGLRYGMVLSVYYLVGGNEIFTPVVSDNFGLGDISSLSFLEFLELVQRKMINARTRKIVTDSKGGWYPTVQKTYETYLKRALLEPNNTLVSNGYTFDNLYPFLSKYNAFFQRFIDQLLSATVIIKKGGLLVRNSMFTKQKFTYKRGLNLYSTSTTDKRGNYMMQYFGDDGSTFKILQSSTPQPPAIVLSVNTTMGTIGTNGTDLGYIQGTGGNQISGYTEVTEYGIKYKKSTDVIWEESMTTGSLAVNSFSTNINNLTEGSTYQYLAVVCTPLLSASGNTLSATIPITPPIVPSGKTKIATSTTETTIVGTGGYDIQRWEDVTSYGMQYRPIGSTLDFNVTPTQFNNIPNGGGICSVTITGAIDNQYTVSNGDNTWLTPSTLSSTPIPDGVTNTVTVAASTVSARTGCVCYTPTVGSMKYVEFNQLSGVVSAPKSVNTSTVTGGYGINRQDIDILCCGRIVVTPEMSPSECFNLQFEFLLTKPQTTTNAIIKGDVYCNSVLVHTRSHNDKISYTATWSSLPTMEVKYGDIIDIVSCACVNYVPLRPLYAGIRFDSGNIGNIVGYFTTDRLNNLYALTSFNKVVVRELEEFET